MNAAQSISSKSRVRTDQLSDNLDARSSAPRGDLPQVFRVTSDAIGEAVQAVLPFALVDVMQCRHDKYSSESLSSSQAKLVAFRGFVRKEKAFTMRRMENKSIRRANLEELATEAGGLDALATRAGVNLKYLQQIRSGFQGQKDRKPRDVGDRLARKLEVAMGQPTGWMDLIHVTTRSSRIDDAADLLSDFSVLTDKEQQEIRIYLKTRADIARAIKATNGEKP